jgi:hypothetical protein
MKGSTRSQKKAAVSVVSTLSFASTLIPSDWTHCWNKTVRKNQSKPRLASIPSTAKPTIDQHSFHGSSYPFLI